MIVYSPVYQTVCNDTLKTILLGNNGVAIFYNTTNEMSYGYKYW